MASRQAARMSGGGARLGTGYGMGTLAECRAAGGHRAHRVQSRPLAVLLRAPGMKASNNRRLPSTRPRRQLHGSQADGRARAAEGLRAWRASRSCCVVFGSPRLGRVWKGRLRSAAPGLRCACYSAPGASPRLACTLIPPGYSGGKAPRSCTPST